jgi:hypothetical protein
MALLQGFFKPRNPEKYRGNVLDIVYRSSWELKLAMYLDEHPSVIEWGSETISISYRSPIDGKIHRYYPDFKVVKLVSGRRKTLIIEVKPSRQCTAPKSVKKGAKPTKSLMEAVKTWGINSAKWEAARAYCADRDWEFVIMTEKELFG